MKVFPLSSTSLGRLGIGASLLWVAGCSVAKVAPVSVTRSFADWSDDVFTGRRITTDHFEIFSTLRDQEFEAALPRFLEAAYQQYAATLPPPNGVDRKLTVYIFADRKEWSRFARRRYPDRYPVYAHIRSGGFTEGDTSVSFYLTRSGTWATLAHEGWHQYVASRFNTSIPAWLNEGLACYHESVDFSGINPKFTPNHNTFRINNLRRAIQNDKLMALPDLVSTDAGQVISHHNSEVAQTYYAQTWALITFLRNGADRRYAHSFEKMLHDVATGTFPVRVSAARLRQPNRATMSLNEAVFPAYFGQGSMDLAGPYHDYLLRLVGF